MLTNNPKTKILLDGGDPDETVRVKNLLGFVDGQTTNPTLIAKNSEIQQAVHSVSCSPQKISRVTTVSSSVGFVAGVR